MNSKIKILGIIPARGGSKSIPRKNVKDFLGKPLIAWTIETALKSGVLDRVIVTTDDDEIADVAKRFGAEVPFKRPVELATDAAPTLPVVQHAVKWLKEKEGYSPFAIMLLEPTSPSREVAHLREAAELFSKSRADTLISVIAAPTRYNPHWLFKVGKDGMAELFTGESAKNIIPRRQLLPEVYARNGALYIFKVDCLGEDPPGIFGDTTKLYVMGSEYNVDIDDPEDWYHAEQAVSKLLSRKMK